MVDSGLLIILALHIVQLLHVPESCCVYFTSYKDYNNMYNYVLCQQAKSEPRKTFCDVLDDIGYGADLFGGLRQSRDIVTSFADLKSED